LSDLVLDASAAIDAAIPENGFRFYLSHTLALALDIEGSRLVTIDERLRRGASRIVDIIGPAEI
jgi:predicted nucleic acid-binding protein